MASIHKNWLIHEHVDDEHAELVKEAKAGKKSAKRSIEKAVKPAAETRGA